MPNDNHARDLRTAETSFLTSLRAKEGKPPLGNTANTKNRIIQKALKENTVSYFRRILDDTTEQMLWSMFITGKFPKLGTDGQPVKDLEGNILYEKVELNPISWNAFKQAVAYKRGTPVVTVDNKNGEPIQVNFNVMGGSGDFFKNGPRKKGVENLKILEQKSEESEETA